MDTENVSLRIGKIIPRFYRNKKWELKAPKVIGAKKRSSQIIPNQSQEVLQELLSDSPPEQLEELGMYY